MSSVAIEYKGLLKGHNDWVTNISTPWAADPSAPRIIASSSRDNKVIVWEIDPEASHRKGGLAGTAVRALCKHKQAVTDVILSPTGDYLLSTSKDKTMRLWDVKQGKAFRTLVGHEKEVSGGALSPDSRQIVSCSYDKTIRLWNTLGEEKYKITEHQHEDWISTVRFSPDQSRTFVVSCGWDKLVKVWDLKHGCLEADLCGHSAPVHSVAISPDGSLCASAGADATVMLWDIVDDVHLYSLEAGSTVLSLCYSPCEYWLCAATETGIKIWDLEKRKVISDIRMVPAAVPNEVDILEVKRASRTTMAATLASLQVDQMPSKHLPWVTCLAWSAEGDYLFAGGRNGDIYVFGLKKPSNN